MIRQSLLAFLAAAVLVSSANSYAATAAPDRAPREGHKLRGVSPARQIAAGPAAVVPAWQAFLAGLPEPAAVTWNRDSGTPQSLFGRLSEAFPEGSAAAARRFLADHAPLFRVTDSLEEIALASEVKTPMGRHFRFLQSYRGIPVAGAEIKVHFNNDGEIVAVNNTSVPEISLSTVRPSLRAREAVAIARAGVPTGPAEEEEQEKSAAALVIRADEGGGPTWEVTLTTAGPTWRIFVDAQDGAILAAPEDITDTRTPAGSSASMPSSRRATTACATRMTRLPPFRRTLARGGAEGLAGNGFGRRFASSGRTKKRAFSATNDFLFDRSDDGFSETMGYYSSTTPSGISRRSASRT
jgi:Zn-dependent metalloprotease